MKIIRKLGLMGLALGALLLSPTTVQARRFHERIEPRFHGHVYVAPGYPYANPYWYSGGGYYDAWGYCNSYW